MKRGIVLTALLLIVAAPSLAGEPAAEALLLDADRAGERIIAVGARGHIIVSDDAARSWRRVESPATTMLTAIHMHDDRVGWAVGHDSLILRTLDGGDTWEQVHHDPDDSLPLLDVWFADARNGFAVGAYGTFLETGDGGDTWQARWISEDDFHLNVLVPAGGNRLLIGAEAGVAYRSDDGGKTWRALAPPYTGSWFGALALSEETFLLAGLRGHLFRSHDGGATWTDIPTGTNATLGSLDRFTDGTIVAVGLGGVLLASHDDGRSVELSRLQERPGIASVLALGDGAVLLVGEFGVRRMTGIP